MNKTKTTKTATQKNLAKQIEKFENANPSIAKAMKILDVSMSQYESALRSLEPTKTYTNNSTKAL
jgi:hypothetical protein